MFILAATQLWRQKIAEIAKDYKGIRFAVADDEKNQQMIKTLGLDESSEEINIGIIANNKKYPMEPMEEFDSDHIREFLDKFLKGKFANCMWLFFCTIWCLHWIWLRDNDWRLEPCI